MEWWGKGCAQCKGTDPSSEAAVGVIRGTGTYFDNFPTTTTTTTTTTTAAAAAAAAATATAATTAATTATTTAATATTTRQAICFASQGEYFF